MKHTLAFAVIALGVASCSTSSGSGVGDSIAGVEPSTSVGAGEVVDDTSEPVATTPDGTTPSSVDPSATNPVVTELPPQTTPPSTAPPAPTSETTVIHVGSDFGGPWTPLAIWDGSSWGEADYTEDGDIIAVPASGFDAVSVASLGLANPVTGLSYGTPDFVCVDDRQGPQLDVGVTFGNIPGVGYSGTSVASNWDIQPRSVQQIGLDSEEYQNLGEAMISAAGVDPAGGDVVQVVRADLDGDGIEEVLVTFEKTTQGFGTKGDYSMVIVRYPEADGAVVDEVLFEHYPDDSLDFPTLGSGGILAVADYNGDAVMEVVLSSTFWESSLAELFEYDGTGLVSVAESGCGL